MELPLSKSMFYYDADDDGEIISYYNILPNNDPLVIRPEHIG
jgi:hypothetical protein